MRHPNAGELHCPNDWYDHGMDCVTVRTRDRRMGVWAIEGVYEGFVSCLRHPLFTTCSIIQQVHSTKIRHFYQRLRDKPARLIFNTPCLHHSTRSTLPKATRCSMTTLCQPCPRDPSRTPTGVHPTHPSRHRRMTTDVEGYEEHNARLTSHARSNNIQSSAAQRFGNLEALKRSQDEQSAARRQSFHDAYGKVGIIGTMWNKYASVELQRIPTSSC